MIRTGPIGSSVYPLCRFINPPTPAPVPRTDNPDHVCSYGKPHRHHATRHHSKAKEPLLAVAMACIFSNDAMPIQKRQLGFCEADTVLPTIDLVFARVPIELRHPRIVALIWLYDHT